MKRSTITRVASVASLGLGLALTLGAPAMASHANKPVHGTCSADSSVTLKTNVQKKGIKVHAQVKTAVAGEAWDWSMSDNGTTVAADQSLTDDDGNLNVKATIANLDGSDTIDFAATDTVTGETCTAEAVVA